MQHNRPDWAHTVQSGHAPQRIAVTDRNNAADGQTNQGCNNQEGTRWWAVLGSNQRPLPCEGSALPLS